MPLCTFKALLGAVIVPPVHTVQTLSLNYYLLPFLSKQRCLWQQHL